MAKLKVKAPDGKTLVVQVPEGTDPAQYEHLADDALTHYAAMGAKNSFDFEKGPDYPNSMYTEANPTADLYATVEGVRAIPAVVKAVPKLAGAAMSGAGALVDAAKGGASKVGGLVGDGLTAIKNQITGNTPRAFGYAQGASASPEARQLAKDSMEYAGKAQPEIGKLVQDSARSPIAMGPEATNPALASGEKGLATAEDVAAMPKPTPAPLDGAPVDASSFNNPIKQGMFGSDPEAMLQTVTAQKNAVGKAIENTLSKYDAVDSYYNPSKVNDMVKGMLERDATGQVMTTGFQGEVNQAMKDALSSLTDYAQGGPIKWSEAARIKSGMQGGAKYGQQGLQHAEAAYKQVANMLMTDIDEQAAQMLAKKGVPADVATYQQLRGAYGKLASLTDSLNTAAKRQFTNSAVPWWVKMGAGAAGATALGNIGTKIVHGLTGGQ